MKKIFTLGLSIYLGFSLNAQMQIGNSGFENWESIGNNSTEPINWNSFKTASGGQNGFASVQIEASNDVRPGSTGTKSCKIFSKDVIFGIIANGNVTTGRINMGSTSATNSENHNRTITGNPDFSEEITTVPDSLVFWVKFVPSNLNAGNQARVKATLHGDYAYKDPEDEASTNQVVAFAEKNYPHTNGQWKRMSIPFKYVGNVTTPKYMLITFTTNKTPGGGSANDVVYVDDIELIYNAPRFTTSATTVCQGTSVQFTNNSLTLGEATPSRPWTNYSWSFPGGSPATSNVANPTVTYNTPGTYPVTLTVSNTFGSRTITVPNHVVVNQIQEATFAYPNATYCNNVANPVPSTVNPGTFTSTAGLVFANTSTGEINLAASNAGTYTVTKTTFGSCSRTATQTVTIFQSADASFTYPSNTICILEGNQTPVTTTAGGTFSSNSANLVFANATTGEIDVNESAGGTYQIEYVIGGGCPDTVRANVTLTSIPNAMFNFANSSVCKDAGIIVPQFAPGASAGVFTSSNGLSLNANNGSINVATSEPGTYSIINNIDSIGACPSATFSSTVTINALPEVTLDLVRDIVCEGGSSFLLAGGQPTGGSYTGSNIGANIFNPANLPTGTIIEVTYKYTNTATSCFNTATDIIKIDACASIEEEITENVIVYPNPTNGLVKIDNVATNGDYTVFNIAGQIVLAGELQVNTNTIDMSNVENGVYLLQVQQGANKQVIRIVKK